MTPDSFQFIVVDQNDGTTIIGADFYLGEQLIGQIIFGELSDDLLDFMISELQEIRNTELIPANAIIH